jgi:hypothetical protein
LSPNACPDAPDPAARASKLTTELKRHRNIHSLPLVAAIRDAMSVPRASDIRKGEESFSVWGTTKYFGPEQWAKSAVPFLLELGPKDNSQPLSTPGR